MTEISKIHENLIMGKMTLHLILKPEPMTCLSPINVPDSVNKIFIKIFILKETHTWNEDRYSIYQQSSD